MIYLLRTRSSGTSVRLLLRSRVKVEPSSSNRLSGRISLILHLTTRNLFHRPRSPRTLCAPVLGQLPTSPLSAYALLLPCYHVACITCTLNTPGRSLRAHYLHIIKRISPRMNDQIKLKQDSFLLIRYINDNCLIINENALRSLDCSLSLVVVDGATCVSLFTSNDLILGPLRFHAEVMLSDLRSWWSVRF